MAVDLLIVNYNTPKLLARLLDTLASDYKPGIHKVYIADNGSPDPENRWMLEPVSKTLRWGEMPVEKVYFNENIGYSAAINQMAYESDSDILCAVNADTWFSTGHVEAVLNSFADTPGMGICGVKQIDELGNIKHGGIFWDGINNPIHRGWNQRDFGDYLFKDKVQCWTVSGSIYYVRRSAWDAMTNYPPYKEIFPEALGAFLPTPMYFEETFCSVLAAHMGYTVWYDGTVPTAGHTWHASNAVGSNVHHFEFSKKIYRDVCLTMGVVNEFHDIKESSFG